MNNKMVVRYSKEFVTGNLKGIWVDVVLPVVNLESANSHINWAHSHKDKPCGDLFGSGTFLVHMARIDYIEAK